MMSAPLDKAAISEHVSLALSEDIGTGDITAELVDRSQKTSAKILTREDMIICGRPWVEEVFHQLDPSVQLGWQVEEGDFVSRGQCLLNVQGSARVLLSGERTALNFLQLLSGVATQTQAYVRCLEGLSTCLLDTRKTLPGLRMAQKYAVRCGGGRNHRLGLYDAYLIKENHIRACGSIAKAVKKARHLHADKGIEVEVSTLIELMEAISVGVKRVLLDNFTRTDIKQAVHLAKGRVELEVSGNLTLETVRDVALSGVDFISVGALTKHVRAIDLSMIFT